MSAESEHALRADPGGGAPEPYVDAPSVARAFGVSRRTVANWTKEGCPSHSWGMRVRRYLVSEVRDWLNARITGTNR